MSKLPVQLFAPTRNALVLRGKLICCSAQKSLRRKPISTPPLQKRAIVVTSINPPNQAMRALVEGLDSTTGRVIIVGDTKSPTDFCLPGATFVGIDDQCQSNLSYAHQCPTQHYARKNIGYLLAMRDGVDLIQETDDDNFPIDGFFDSVERSIATPISRRIGWTNVFRYFSDLAIWPRGLPLNRINDELATFDSLDTEIVDCPIQQGLANGNPDVDAVFRLVSPMDVTFRADRSVALGQNVWCPFNSQNTIWFPDAFPLLYLPAYCGFRMTDIWRSFIAQRIAWENNWAVLFHHPTVCQDRNPHDLMRDFADEIPGYLHNERIAHALADLTLASGQAAIGGNLLLCYKALIKLGVIDGAELPLLRCWLSDLGL